MRVLLDECLPRRLKRLITGHDVVTVPEAGWAGRGNGDLLRLASEAFDAFVTVDRNLPAQQRRQTGLAVVILVTPSNRLQDIEPLVPELLRVLATVSRGELVRLGG